MNRSILLVEDSDEFKELVARYLEREPYQLTVAGDVRSAIAALESGTEFAVALVDFWLGSENATPVMDHISSNYPGLSLIVISGGSNEFPPETVKALGEISGALHFLQKPFTRSELLGLLASAAG